MAVFKPVNPSIVEYGSSTLVTVVVCHLHKMEDNFLFEKVKNIFKLISLVIHPVSAN